MVLTPEMSLRDSPSGKQRRLQPQRRKSRFRALRRSWPGCSRTSSQGTQLGEGRLAIPIPVPWLDKPQQQKASISHDDSSGMLPSIHRDMAAFSGEPSDDAQGAFIGESEEFTVRSVQIPEKGNSLLRAYKHRLGYMEEDVVEALGSHPCPDEVSPLIFPLVLLPFF